MYSDKSAMTMKTSGLVFYPLHTIMMNVRKEFNKIMVSRTQSIVAYIPTKFVLKQKQKCFSRQLNQQAAEGM